jgi:hypothetical protein
MALALGAISACQSFPPALTGVTIVPSNAEGEPYGEAMWRTRRQPPIPLIGLRPGTDPSESAPLLNQSNGEIAVTLAGGIQNFVLYTTAEETASPFVIALFLDHESTPALSGVVDSDLARPVVASRARSAMGLDGEAVVNRSSVSVVRGGYRVSLRRAAFRLPVSGIDAVGPWGLRPDQVSDAVGMVTIEVEPAPNDGNS